MPQISEQAFVYAVKVNDNGDGTLSFEQKVVGGDLPVFVNKLKAGSLEIEKTVVDVGKGNPDPDREFTFHVKLKGKNLPKFPDLEDPASDSTSTGSSTGSTFSFRIEWGGGKPATSFKLRAGDSTCAIEIALGSAGALVTLAGLWLAFDRSRS